MKRHLLLAVGFVLSAQALSEGGAPKAGGKFENEAGPREMKMLKIIKARFTTPQLDKRPEAEVPLHYIGRDELDAATSPLLYRLGHSSILIKLGDEYVLTDPVFSERASPVQWAGPRRFHPVPLEPEALPDIKAVVISHDHYDHLDYGTIKRIESRVENFVVPRGVGDHLRRWGIEDTRIHELDWWQGLELGDLSLTATPAQHFSGRGMLDGNRTLWASWVIEGAGAKLFFSGDTGYFDGFRDIGERFGPFDITLIETGAYDQLWAAVHMLPEQSVQAHIDLRGKAMLPIHNSTFNLAFHPWYEPMERAAALAAERQVKLLTPIIGAPVDVLEPRQSPAWWRELNPQLVAVPADSEALSVKPAG
ncbi:MBL fold metallo-hydrolase [Halioglobus maricola]|uniref:MBL fold metallo-hydrolase n=1 Tax=Halioglobus maricola TaxID=2601894 RepID=A0A5P9NPZ3_9GAMM|nr:MBL fold metallo-hydrolase [Halioglobus maricola]QFU77364.1 MBL fold metallo-hydrolase [Halioglobus maricola]